MTALEQTATGQPADGLIITGEVAIGFPPARTGYAAAAYGNAQPNTNEGTWLVLRPDGSITAFAGKVEYGQGIRSGLAVEVADELRVALSAVEVILADTDLVPWDMGTFGSQSTARVGVQLRKAAATARQALLEAAADRFDLPIAQLEARDGRVSSKADPGHSATYAELVTGQRVERRVEDAITLTAPADFTVMGRHNPRVDAIARVTGAALYSQDISVPGMLYAKVLRPPS